MQSGSFKNDGLGERIGYAGDFVSALLDPARKPPTFISGPNGKAADNRYAIYRNNVTVSLIDALAAIFPATVRITGTDFFRAMARSHVRAIPPTSPLLFEYGRDFPGFIEQYTPARSMPWLVDVARLERLWLDAYHAADDHPLSPATLAAIPPEQLANVILTPHPATRVLRSHYSALTIFTANRADGPVARINAGSPEDALITRPELNVMVRLLPPGGAVFLSHLLAGEPLGAAAATACAEEPGFDLSTNIAGMVETGVFKDLVRDKNG